MKRLLTWAVAPALMATMVFVGCQKTIESVDGGRDVAMLSSGGGDCNTVCIDENSGDAFAGSRSATVNWGQTNTKNGTVRVWNTLTHIVYEFTSTVAISDLVVNEVSSGLGAAANTPLLYSVALTDGWAACDVVTNSFQLSGGGPPIVFSNVTYSLIGACGCEDEFSAELTCGDENTLVVTFTAEEAGYYVVQGGLTAGASIVSATSNGLTLMPGHPSAGGPSSVTRWEGEIGECETVTVTITFTGGNGVGSWSAKLGGETKGSSDDQSCN
jgi:hypothetical protein